MEILREFKKIPQGLRLTRQTEDSDSPIKGVTSGDNNSYASLSPDYRPIRTRSMPLPEESNGPGLQQEKGESPHLRQGGQIKPGKVRSAISYLISLSHSGIKKDYDIQSNTLGTGKYGVVRTATRRKTGEKVAVKILPKVSPDGKDEHKFAMREVEIMSKVDHPNCIGYYSMYESQKHVYIVMELVSGGQLLERIVAKEHYSETEAAKVFVQIIAAIDYLHSKGVVHRDLKPENVLYSTPADDSMIKVCDFGLGRSVEADELSAGRARFWSRCGSPDYVAPEVLMREGYGKECDVWSAGVILYILLCGFPPFGQRSVMTKFDHIKKGQFEFPEPQWTGVSEEAKDLIRGMLCVDVAKRLTCPDCVRHKWFNQLSENKLSHASMPQMQARLKEWNAARKLMAAIHTCTALSRMTSCDVQLPVPTVDEAEELLQQIREDPETEDELRVSFRMLDRGGTGRVRVKDLAEAVGALGFKRSHSELKAMVESFDVYNKGYIDFDEYCIMMALYGKSALEKEGEPALIFPSAQTYDTATVRRQRSDSLPLRYMSGMSPVGGPLSPAINPFAASTGEVPRHLLLACNDPPSPLFGHHDETGSSSKGGMGSLSRMWQGLSLPLLGSRSSGFMDALGPYGSSPNSPDPTHAVRRDSQDEGLGYNAGGGSTSDDEGGDVRTDLGRSPMVTPSPARSRNVTKLGGSMGSLALSCQELQDAFSAMDIKSRGNITPPELKRLLMGFGVPITDEEAVEMVRICDTNGDGMIDISDLWSMMQLAPDPAEFG